MGDLRTHVTSWPGQGSPASVLRGVGSCLPPRRVENQELAERLGRSPEWIFQRSGIRYRHVVEPGTTSGDLAVAAGREALARSALSDVGAVVVATTSPDRPCPGTAPSVASRLGMTGVTALDVQAVCAGFVYALGVAQGLIAAGTVDSALVIGTDTLSLSVAPDDPTSMLFGDGAGAVVLRSGDRGDPGALGPCVLGSDGGGRDLITVRGGGSEERSGAGAGGAPADPYLRLEGREVFWRAVEYMASASREALDAARWKPQEVDRIVAHQANARILAMLAQRLGTTADRTLSNIDRVGNTSAASIPILLDHAARTGSLEPGHRILLTAFGGGLTWGAMTFVWPHFASSS
ncbi:ketoacyl-ACP synthase III [Streptomyces actuosus]|uniref:Ketoacyl-ACP synthase III n=1 Tax=Streptomyces actuosus TaxID=1885 RepID=A0ABS2VIJ5_STRAS|nr:beta-ketoacyl-ACP synthase III [Streptomyces actuosus]MBN0042920.1 ketoacyl-ACP synthase III [Streptomyces actuosus]